MLTYKSLEIFNEGSKDQNNEKSNDITHNHIENMQKNFRSHRAALDFDKGFIVASLTSGKDFDLKRRLRSVHARRRGEGNNRKMIHKINSPLQDYSHQASADVAHTRCRHCQRRAIALPTAAEAGTAAAPPPSFRRRRAVALPPRPQPARCSHRAANVALCAAAALRVAVATAPLPCCRRRRSVALPPPLQPPRCCHRAAAVTLCATAANGHIPAIGGGRGPGGLIVVLQ